MSNPFALDTPPASPAQPQTPAPVAAPVQPAPTVDPQYQAFLAQQAAAQQQAAPAAPAQPAAGVVDDDPFGAPAPQAPKGPRMRDLYGRLLLVVPYKVETVPNQKEPGKMQERMTADVICLDGGPIPYGGAPEATPPVPHDKTASVPHKNPHMYVSNTGLVSQCRDALANRLANRGGPRMVLGRLAVGQAKEPGKNAPYLLTPATEADKALARQYLASVDPFA